MAYFKINQPNQPTKWIKSIDRADGTLEFSTDRNGCFQRDYGFFADSEFAYLMFHFKKEYPELQYMTIDNEWYDEPIEGELVNEANPIGVLEQANPIGILEQANPIGILEQDGVEALRWN